MKLLKCLFVLSFAFSSLVSATQHRVNDVVEYTLEAPTNLIESGTGSITIEQITGGSYELGVGTILRLDYDMTSLSGQQLGYIRVFVPGNLDDIHSVTATGTDYGAFHVKKLAGTDMVDRVSCTKLNVSNIKHEFAGTSGKAQVLEIHREKGTLKELKDINVTLSTKTGGSEKVLQALKVHVTGKAKVLFLPIPFTVSFVKK